MKKARNSEEILTLTCQVRDAMYVAIFADACFSSVGIYVDTKRSFTHKMQNKSCMCPFNQVFVLQIQFKSLQMPL